METRKVLEMGGGTMLISLPKDWARRNNIVKGGSVIVEETSPRRLLVRPTSNPDDSRTVLIEYPKENPSYLSNDVTGAYLFGSDVIKIKGDQTISREDRERMKTTIRRLVGLEIMDEDSKSMTIQFLPEHTGVDPVKIVRRMGSLTQGMLRDTSEALSAADEKTLSLIAERDDEIDRLYFLLVRTIRTATIDPEIAERYGLTPVECLDFRVLASFLEGLGDTISEYAKTSPDLKPLVEVNEAREALEVLGRMEDISVRMFLNRNSDQGRKAHLEVESMQESVSDLSRTIARTKRVPTRTMIDLLSMLERVSKILVDISDLAQPTYLFETLRPEDTWAKV